MSGNNSLKIDLQATEGLVDESKTRHKAVMDVNSGVDKNKRAVEGDMNGGVGAEQLAGQRNKVNTVNEESDRHAVKGFETTRNVTGEVVRNVTRAANDGFRA